MKYLHWFLRIVVAGILLQTLYFKFTGHPDSVYIFDQAGIGAPGRIIIGIMELIAAILMLMPRYTAFGAMMGVGLMVGAIGLHLTKLGIVVKDDGGILFTLALVVFVGSLILAYLNRKTLYLLFVDRGAVS